MSHRQRPERRPRYARAVPRAPQSRSGRFAELDASELAEIVERAYQRDELPDWELVFELSRRATSVEASDVGQGSIGASRPG
jgi:hypothetical protein